MREIKFRGQDEDGKWLYGDLRQRMGYWPAIIESYCTDEGKVGYREIAVKEETVGEFTGLKDKNGVEIYEGDVVETITNGCRYVQEVVWSDIETGFSFRGHGCGPLFHESSCMEVIGNIYDRSATQEDACQSKNSNLPT